LTVSCYPSKRAQKGGDSRDYYKVNCAYLKRTARLAVPRDFLHDLYNAWMTSPPKKHGRAARLLAENRLTEKRNAASRNLDRMSAREIVRLMNREDRKVAAAVGRELPGITRAVDAAGQGAIAIDFVGTGTAMGAAESTGVIAKSHWNNATGATRNTALALVDERISGANINLQETYDNSFAQSVK
jgi:hypothetical protein